MDMPYTQSMNRDTHGDLMRNCPGEVILRIVEFLAADGKSESQRASPLAVDSGLDLYRGANNWDDWPLVPHRDLANVVLVCRAWFEHLAPLLYRSVTLNTRERRGLVAMPLSVTAEFGLRKYAQTLLVNGSDVWPTCALH